MGVKNLDPIEAPRILIIDDDQDILDGYNSYLKGSNYQLTFTKSAQEAWQILEKEKFELVITDLHMPFLNGEELIGIIRKNVIHKKVPMLIASGCTNKIHESQADRDSSLHLIKKPFCSKEFLEKIKSIVE